MGAKAFPALSSLKRDELENAPADPGQLLAKLSCERAFGTVANVGKTKTTMVSIHLMLGVIVGTAPAGVLESSSHLREDFCSSNRPFLLRFQSMFLYIPLPLASLTVFCPWLVLFICLRDGVQTAACWVLWAMD